MLYTPQCRDHIYACLGVCFQREKQAIRKPTTITDLILFGGRYLFSRALYSTNTHRR